jgi:hypothetical protein
VSSPEEGACDMYWNEQNLDPNHLEQEEVKEGRCCISYLSLSLRSLDCIFSVAGIIFSQKLFFSFASIYHSLEQSRYVIY